MGSRRYDTEYHAQYTRKEIQEDCKTSKSNPYSTHRSRENYPFADDKSTMADILGLPDDNVYSKKFSSMGIAARRRTAQNVFKGICSMLYALCSMLYALSFYVTVPVLSS